MRKGVGLGALARNTQTASQFATHGLALQKSYIDELTTQLAVFQAQLSQFSRTHAKDIRNNPAFRAEFARMCTAIGVNPLASSSHRKGSFWAELLGPSVNDFYFELAVRVVEVCRQTRRTNGGLVAVTEVRDRLCGAGSAGADDVSEDDILRAVQALKPLGEGFAVVEVGRRKMIRSVPKELNKDQSRVLEAIEVAGFVTSSMLRVNYEWDRARVQTVVEDLLADSLVWVDEQAEEKEYWAPTFMGVKRK